MVRFFAPTCRIFVYQKLTRRSFIAQITDRLKKTNSIKSNIQYISLDIILQMKFRSSSQLRRQRSKGARSFRGQKILQPGHPDALFFLKKSWRPFLSCRPQNTGRQRRFTVNKAVRYGNIFIFCWHYCWSKAIRRAWARAEPGLEPGQWIFQPGHLTWRALV